MPSPQVKSLGFPNGIPYFSLITYKTLNMKQLKLFLLPFLASLFLFSSCETNENHNVRHLQFLQEQYENVQRIKEADLAEFYFKGFQLDKILQENGDTLYPLAQSRVEQGLHALSREWEGGEPKASLEGTVDQLIDEMIFPHVKMQKKRWEKEKEQVLLLREKIKDNLLNIEWGSVELEETELLLKINIELLSHYILRIVLLEYEFRKVKIAYRSFPCVFHKETNKAGDLELSIVSFIEGSQLYNSEIEVKGFEVTKGDLETYKVTIPKGSIPKEIEIVSTTRIPKTGEILTGMIQYEIPN